jgi:hypothetical protein
MADLAKKEVAAASILHLSGFHQAICNLESNSHGMHLSGFPYNKSHYIAMPFPLRSPRFK